MWLPGNLELTLHCLSGRMPKSGSLKPVRFESPAVCTGSAGIAAALLAFLLQALSPLEHNSNLENLCWLRTNSASYIGPSLYRLRGLEV